MRGDGGVVGEGRVVGVPKFHSWGKCTFLWPVYYIGLFILCESFISLLGCNYYCKRSTILPSLQKIANM